MIARALTVAGSDSGGGAGIQADLKTFAALGVYGMSAVTAVTAQNTVGVLAWEAMPPRLVEQQIEAVAEDIGVDAAKTGMLANASVIETVATALRRSAVRRLVVDPVMVAKSGDALLEPAAQSALRERLLPLALVVTPNLPEAAALTGVAVESLESAAGRREAARRLHELGPRWVVVKGGHLATEAVDLVYDGRDFDELRRPRIDTRNTHGTGCTFSAAIAAHLARGLDAAEAIGAAKDFIHWAIGHALDLGRGHGPTNHFYRGA